MLSTSEYFGTLHEVGLVWTLSCSVCPQAAGEVLRNCGMAANSIVETRDAVSVRLSVFLSDPLFAETLRKALKASHIPGTRIFCRILKDRDWVDRWKEGIKPFGLTPTLDVVPVWCSQGPRKTRRRPIRLDTTLAFGTGLHETTRFMAQLIESKRGKFSRVLDIGTGTGLLAIVALMNGARRVEGVDLDQSCLKVARQNLAANQLRFHKVYAGDFSRIKVPGSFDLVAANLNTFDLLCLRRKIVSKVRPGGDLAISGIAVNLYSQIREGFHDLPLRCLRVRTGKQWVACLFKKKGEKR